MTLLLETSCAVPQVFCLLEEHISTRCELRGVLCSCGLTIRRNELDEHLLLNCADRLVFCTLGCGQKMKTEFLASHMEFACTKKNLKYQKEIMCPNGCGEKMMIKDVIEHVTYNCPRRLTECPLRCGCVFQLEGMSKHVVFCPNR